MRRDDLLRASQNGASGCPTEPAMWDLLGARDLYSGDHGAWAWMVSPRANISTNWSMRLERVSGFLALPIL